MSAASDAFITEELEAFGVWLQAQAKARLVARHIEVKDELLNSLSVITAANQLNMLFSDHGRMHDMGAGRGYHKGKFLGSAEKALFLKGRKPSKWYSRFVWGAIFGTLEFNLANKFLAEVPGMLVDAYMKEAA